MSVVSLPNGGASNDLLALALTGDAAFKKRLKELLDAKQQAEEANAKLAIGTEIAAARDEADKQKAIATEKLAVAKKRSADLILNAEQQAADVIREASDKARSMVQLARERADQILKQAEDYIKDATAIKKAAEEEVASLRGEAKKIELAKDEAITAQRAANADKAAVDAEMQRIAVITGKLRSVIGEF